MAFLFADVAVRPRCNHHVSRRLYLFATQRPFLGSHLYCGCRMTPPKLLSLILRVSLLWSCFSMRWSVESSKAWVCSLVIIISINVDMLGTQLLPRSSMSRVGGPCGFRSASNFRASRNTVPSQTALAFGRSLAIHFTLRMRCLFFSSCCSAWVAHMSCCLGSDKQFRSFGSSRPRKPPLCDGRFLRS